MLYRIVGWKQKEHPMLYNALHIGDRLLSVAGILVQNATDAQRLIRGAPSLYVSTLPFHLWFVYLIFK